MVNRVLFLMEKFCDADPKCGPTNSESQLVGAIESTGLVGETKHFYFDILTKQLGNQKMAEMLLEDCKVFQPDLILYTPMGGPLGEQLNPPGEITNKIRSELSIKLYTCLWDTEGREWETWARWLPAADGVLVIDTVVRAEYYRRDPRIFQAYSAIDSRDFYSKGLERDIDVCFVGGWDPQRWPQRAQQIAFLRANGIDVVAAGGQRANRLSWEEYANFLNRSKISLNFTVVDLNAMTGSGEIVRRRSSQLKGRVFESMSCKAMLVEDDGYQTKEFFEPGKDYIMFHNQEDLLGKIRYFLAHDDEREAIALSGWQKVTGIYDARNMWVHLFGKMGFEIPRQLQENPRYLKHEEKMECLSAL